MKLIRERINNFIESVWYSYWRFAIWNVLSQWISGVILIVIGIWTVQALYSISFAAIIDLVPDVIYSSICNNVRSVICLIIVIMSLQVYVKHKWYKVLHVIIEVQNGERRTHEEKLRKCDLGIGYCESRKEVLSVEKDFIKSFTPLPIVTAILGYVLEKIGIQDLNWQFYVIICVGMIVLYVFLCVRNIRKFRENQMVIDKWREAKCRIINMQEPH